MYALCSSGTCWTHSRHNKRGTSHGMAAAGAPHRVTVDTNCSESQMYARLLAKAASGAATVVERTRLDVGDVLLTSTRGSLIIERKTTVDFLEALWDGRGREQAVRGSKD